MRQSIAAGSRKTGGWEARIGAERDGPVVVMALFNDVLILGVLLVVCYVDLWPDGK